MCPFAPLRLCVKPQLAALVILLATFAHAQNSQFLFDANGNLAVQMADTIFPPQITGQPQNQIVAAGELAAFAIVVADPRSLTYQWRFNGTNLSGENGVSLLLDNVSTNNEGPYQVVLTNPSGSVTSAPAFLMIDRDADGMADSWETTYFTNLSRNATSDFDGDGVSNLREFLDGTDPTDPNSARYRLLVIREGGTVLKSPEQPSYNKGETVTLTVTASSNELFHAWLGDIVTRNNPVTLVMTNDKTVYARFTPIAFTWTNVASGDWNSATNWTPNLAPGLNDIANINSAVTVTLNTDADCAEVTLGGSGPTLTGSGNLIVRGNFFWTVGNMGGSGWTILDTNATLNVSGAVSLSGRTLENGGTVLWSGAGFIGANGGAVITNRAGALFHAQNAAGLGGGIANGRLDNAGVFRKSGTTGTTAVANGMSFNNSGTVDIQMGTLDLGGGGTHSGSLSLSPAATLVLSGGTYTADANSTITGAGQLTVSGGTAALAGLVNVSGSNTFSGGTADFTGNHICTNNLVTISGGAVNFSGTGLVSPAVLNLLNGTLGGTASVTVANLMNWPSGTMGGSGRTIVATGATLTVANPSSVILNTRTLENGGTVLWTGAGNIGLLSSVITNRAGALFHVQNAATFGSAGGGPRFDNAGTFRKSANTGMTTIGSDVSFNNTGTVEIQTGTLLCNGSFANNGAVNLLPGTTTRLVAGGSANGTFTSPATAIVEWTGGTFTLNAGAQLNGAGLYRINGGELAANTNLAADNLDLISGNLDGSGAVTVNKVMNWPGGTMGGSGRTIISTGAAHTIANPSSVVLSARTLENGGMTLWTGAGNILLLSGIITNRAGALFHVQNAAIMASVGGGPRFDNAGTFRKSANTGMTTIGSGVSFNNSGTVDIRSGILAANGGYVSTPNALLNCALGGTTAGTNYGQLQVGGAVTLNGALSVDFLPGFTPATNDTFTVLTAGSRNNTFTSFSYPSNRVSLSLSNSPTSVILRATDIFSVPQPVLLPPQLVVSNALLTWTATSNVTYRLEFNPDLNPANWNALPGDVTTLSNTASKLDALTPSNRLYRVRLLP